MAEEQYISKTRIPDVLRNWAKESAQQLQDAYKMQKIYPAAEVWPGWFHENELRKAAHRNNAWYSTGRSYRLAKDIKVEGNKIQDMVIDFHTTLGALYAESGAGLTGNKHTRGARSRRGRKRIKIDRVANYTHRQRYVDNWIPMQGKTHRPSTRQQANLIKRRLAWLSTKIYTYDLTAWLGYQVGELMNIPENGWKKNKFDLEIVFKPSKKKQEDSKRAWDKAHNK